jgi:hypothetical protein
MSKLSYAKQVSLARRRLKRLKSEGISNNATKILEAELNTFYKKNDMQKRGYGINISDRMTPSQRKQISNIITNFLNSAESTLSGIKQAAKEITGKTYKSAKNASSVVDMNEVVILSDAAIVESLQSQVVHDVYEQQKREGFDTDAARYAMSKYAIENMDNLSGMSVSDIVAGIQNELETIKEIAPEFWEDAYEDW